MNATTQTIGFVGLGIMGASMSRNLARKGHTVLGYSRTQSKVEALRSDGITPASLREIAERCNVVMLSLTDGATVQGLLFGSHSEEIALAPNMRKGSLLIDTTTIAPREAVECYTRCADLGIDFVDAPVSGGDVGARNGTLTCMVGGAPAAYCRAETFLKAIGSKIFHVGAPGAGQRMKAINQVAVALGIVAMTEAILFAQNQGIDPAQAVEVLQGGAAGSWALANYAPRLLRGDLQPGFSASHMLKDLRIALSEVREPLDLPATEAVTARFEELVEKFGTVGNHALIKTYTS